MDKPWKNYLPALCGAIGTVLLAGTAWACLSLERGGPPDRIAVAAALLLLAVLALAGHAADPAAARRRGYAAPDPKPGLRRDGL